MYIILITRFIDFYAIASFGVAFWAVGCGCLCWKPCVSHHTKSFVVFHIHFLLRSSMILFFCYRFFVCSHSFFNHPKSLSTYNGCIDIAICLAANGHKSPAIHNMDAQKMKKSPTAIWHESLLSILAA